MGPVGFQVSITERSGRWRRIHLTRRTLLPRLGISWDSGGGNMASTALRQPSGRSKRRSYEAWQNAEMQRSASTLTRARPPDGRTAGITIARKKMKNGEKRARKR